MGERFVDCKEMYSQCHYNLSNVSTQNTFKTEHEKVIGVPQAETLSAERTDC